MPNRRQGNREETDGKRRRRYRDQSDERSKRNRRVEKFMSDITDYFVDKIDRRIGEKVRKGLMVSDGETFSQMKQWCGSSKNNKPKMRKKDLSEKPPCKSEGCEKPPKVKNYIDLIDFFERFFQNLTVKEMEEKVKEHERKAAIYAKALAGDQEDYFKEYQK